MKVCYSLKGSTDLKEIKAELKAFGGRCAKIADGKLEYQIKDEQEKEAYGYLKEKGFIE